MLHYPSPISAGLISGGGHFRFLFTFFQLFTSFHNFVLIIFTAWTIPEIWKDLLFFFLNYLCYLPNSSYTLHNFSINLLRTLTRVITPHRDMYLLLQLLYKIVIHKISCISIFNFEFLESRYHAHQGTEV